MTALPPSEAFSSSQRTFAVESVDLDVAADAAQQAHPVRGLDGNQAELLEGDVWIDLRTEPATLVVGTARPRPLEDKPPPWYERFAVRAVDLLIATPLFVVSIPIILVLMLSVRLDSPGPVLFSSRRITRDGRFFNMWKLRTMVTNGDELLRAHFRADPEAEAAFAARMKLEHDPRVTRLGRVLRRWSLDELPQLVNVILGHMSLVGPRPLLPEEAERMGPAFPTVVRVKGGITGLWQISGRSTLTFEERVPLDVEYATERTLLKDFRIMVVTVAQLLRGRPGAF